VRRPPLLALQMLQDPGSLAPDPVLAVDGGQRIGAEQEQRRGGEEGGQETGRLHDP
jgi:hypothetical protein